MKSILLSWKDLTALEVKEPPYLCNPLVPEGGIIMLHGKWSTGKSPLTWHLASCIGEGREFFGMPCRKGRVLYLEVDTPMLLVKDRTDKLPVAENVWFGFIPQHILALDPQAQDVEFKALSSLHPDLVVVNTLRKVHPWKDTDSETPNLVYSAFQRRFPGSALLFVHHDKKDSQDPKAKYTPSEAFSGSQHWADDAQVTLHLRRHSGKNILSLENPKNQTAKTIDPIILQLHEDGSKISRWGEGRVEAVRRFVGPVPSVAGAKDLSAREKDELLAEELRVSSRTARSLRLKAEKEEGSGGGRSSHTSDISESLEG